MTEHKGWNCPEPGKYIPNISYLTEDLQPGMYETRSNPSWGFFLSALPIGEQKLIKFPDSVSLQVMDDINKFWAQEAAFRRYKFPYKRGILMFGPPGGGKSSTIALICRDVIDRGGIILKFNDFHYFSNGLKLLKRVQPTLPVVALMEDLDQIIYDNNLSDILNLLDGVEATSDKVVYLATTNRPEDLQENIKNRPSRFDRRFEFGPPSAVAREHYLSSLFQEDKPKQNMKRWVKDTEGFSFAHLKELFISVMLFDNDYKESVQILKDMGSALTDDKDDDDD